MTATELDTAYTALAHAMDSVGERQTPLLLSMVALALIAEQGALDKTLGIIARAQLDALEAG